MNIRESKSQEWINYHGIHVSYIELSTPGTYYRKWYLSFRVIHFGEEWTLKEAYWKGNNISCRSSVPHTYIWTFNLSFPERNLKFSQELRVRWCINLPLLSLFVLYTYVIIWRHHDPLNLDTETRRKNAYFIPSITIWIILVYINDVYGGRNISVPK